MSELRLETWTLPAAELGPENPLPPLRTARELHEVDSVDPAVPAEMRRNIAYGRVDSIMPYTLQDGFSRQRKDRNFRVAVLENQVLRATFLLEFGGRLWSLFHKPSLRELLDVNPVFQPANLALRNAWFSGGVEWNIGTIGHSPFTCSSLFAARIEGPDDTPIVRMYEWERIRQVPFQIDAYLPDNSPVLYIRIRIINLHDHEVPMYWWSNIAVPETTDTRVIVPAKSVYRFTYDNLNVLPVPTIDGVDNSYATNLNRAADFFYHIPDGKRPWITALDKDGKGLVQTSTDRLKGRKLFVWGMGAGGRHWQEHLSVHGQAYIEIQAGLARTQLEHIPLPAQTEWSWLEAYGLLDVDASATHGKDWESAQSSVEIALEALVSRAELEAEFSRGKDWQNQPPDEILQRGSGWGALEVARLAQFVELPASLRGLPFPESALKTEQTPWAELLHTGILPESSPKDIPSGFVIDDHWHNLLEESIKISAGSHWLSWYHLGVMRYAAKEFEGARKAWEKSLEKAKTPWVLRNLAILADDEGRINEAAELYVCAVRLLPSLLPLVIECGQLLIRNDRADTWLSLLADLPEYNRQNGRIRLLEAQAALSLDNLQLVEEFFAAEISVADIREGETSLSDLWYGLQEKRLSAQLKIPVDANLKARVRREHPIPSQFDFSMTNDGQ